MIARKNTTNNLPVQQDKLPESNNEQVVDSSEINLNINFKIGNKIINEDVDRVTKIPTVDKLNPTTLISMLAENPNIHARWNVLNSQASFDTDIQKMRFEVWMARRSKEVRNELQREEKGRVTDKMVQETILLDPEYEKRQERVLEAERQQRQIYALATGIGKKGERLKDIAFMMRFEGETLVEGKQAMGRRIRHDTDNSKSSGRKDFEEADPSVNGGWPTRR
jgi:hypothetical protein